MATQIKHYPPAGQSLIGLHDTHGGACRCNPTSTMEYKRSASGRFGRHQGRTLVAIVWQHNFIKPEPEEEPGLHLVPSEAHYAAREDAWLARMEQHAC